MKIPKPNVVAIAFVMAGSMVSALPAAQFLMIDSISVVDSGSTATIDMNLNHSQDIGTGIITKTGDGGAISNISGDLNLLTFSSGMTTYSVDNSKTDPDKRDYIVSSQKLYDLGFECKRDLDYGIMQMDKFYDLLSESDWDKCRNY